MDKKTEQKLANLLREQLSRQHTMGVMQGSRAMCAVIREMTDKPGKTDAERLEMIRVFCDHALNEKEDAE